MPRSNAIEVKVMSPMAGGEKSVAFDPQMLSDLVDDPLFGAINNRWTDKQQYGRIAFDAAYKHAIVNAAFNGRLAILMSKRPRCKPRTREPTTVQQEIADFRNHILENLDWVRFISGPTLNAFQYGFGLNEILTKWEMWRGKTMLTLDRVKALPQPTLDNGFVARAEFSELALSNEPRYRCFSFDIHGNITAYRQFGFYGAKGPSTVEWRGEEMQRILHFKRRGGDGNPWGESVLFGAMDSWGTLYSHQKMEDAFLDTGLPWMFGTYKSQQGETRQKVHDGVKATLEASHVDAAHRFLMWADGDLKSVAASNENYTEHVTRKQKRLENYIWNVILPKALVAETETSEADSRNVVQVYFKNVLKADLEEIGVALTSLLDRLTIVNYGNVNPEDLAPVTWSSVTENETRVAQGLLTALLPHVDSEQLPEFVHDLFDFVDPRYIAASNEKSVQMERQGPAPLPDPNKMAAIKAQPPPKEEGQVRERMDQQTENPSAQNTAT